MNLKSKLSHAAQLLGMIVTLKDTAIVELVSECGFDWLWIDMEHSPYDLREVLSLVQAKKTGCHALIRIPVNSAEWIKRVLDLGVDGIIIPHVSTEEEAKLAVQHSLYPPLGERSVGMSRVGSYGMNSNYKTEANQNRALFVQIEDKIGVENAREIVALAGVDGVIIGPYDLSGSYGKLGQVQDPEIVSAIDSVFDVCKKAKKPIGIFAKEASVAKVYLNKGFQLVAVGVDVHYFWTSAKQTLEQLLGKLHD